MFETSTLLMRKGKEIERKGRFLPITGSGNIMTSVDLDKLCLHNLIPRAKTKKLYEEVY